jgi:exopolysaccharide biosynthesis operon protein EpsL
MNKMNLMAPALALTGLFLAPPALAQEPPTEEEPPASAEEPASQPPPAVIQPPSATGEAPPAAGEPSRAAAQPAAAQQDHPVMAAIGRSVTWDSNLFRLPPSVDPQTLLGRPAKSDRISATYVGLRVDKLYAQQRFLLDLTGTAYRYDNFSFLDFDALEYRGTWRWYLTPRVSGTLGADRSQALVNFTDFRDPSQRNVRTAENRLLSVDGWLFGGWHLLGGLRQQEVKNSVAFVQLGSIRASGAQGGVKYVARSGSSVTFNLRSLVGHFTDRTADPVTLLDDGFRRSESELLATWIVTGKSTLDGRLARLDYRSSHFGQRDFSGTAARLEYRWAPAAKLSANIAVSRDVEPWQDNFASYRTDHRLSFGPIWQLAARTALGMSLERIASDFRNPVAAFAGPQRHDTFRSAQLTLDWQLLRNVSIRVSLQRSQQMSTDPAFEFKAAAATLGGSLMF